jgi:hypothetical protein
VNDAGTIRESALTLFEELSKAVDRDFRRVGVRISGLADAEGQTSLSEYLGQVRR